MAILNSSRFLHGEIINADQSNLELVGGEASFLFNGNELLATPETLELTGHEALFYVGYQLDADSADLELVGGGAIFGYQLEADPADLELDGSGALFGYQLNADPGILALYPEDSQLLNYLPFGNTLNLIIQVRPVPVSPYIQKQDFRAFVGLTELEITDFNFSGDVNKIGFELTLTLADLSQRSLITKDAVYKFEVWDSGTWQTIIDTGKLLQRDFSISWDDGPADEFSFQITSNLDSKLEKSPVLPLILYDSGRLTLNADDFEVLEDSEGNTYPTTLETVTGLSTNKIFDRILVDECGFSAVRSNLPDWNIRRVDFPLTQTFFSPISSKIGMFDPLIFPVGDELWIQDPTQEFTNGMPAPEILNVAKYKRLQATAAESFIGAYEMDYIANENEYDATDVRIEPTNESTSLIGNPDYTVTLINKYYLDFYKNGKVVRSQYEATFKDTIGYSPLEPGVLQTISEFEEQIHYDMQGNQIGSTVIEKAMVPQFNNGIWTVSLQEISREENGWKYAGHPYKSTAQFNKRMERKKTGLVAVDSENLSLGKPAKMAFLKALESHNINEETTFENTAIETYEENFNVETRDRVRMRVKKTNHLVGAVPLEYDEPKTGDIAIEGSSTVTKPILILPNDGDTLSGKRTESISMDELPLEYAKPLTRRILRKGLEKPYQFQCEIYGWIVGLRRGLLKTIHDRGAEVGKMVIEGFNVSGRNLGSADREILTTIRGRQV